MTFERNQAVLDKDFQLFYSVGNKEIGLTPLAHRPISAEDGYFMLLISPQVEVSKTNDHPARPGARARHVRQHGRRQDGAGPEGAEVLLGEPERRRPLRDRHVLHHVRPYRDKLVEANSEHLDNAKKWVDGLKAGGGTAIQAALDAALEMRTKDEGRSFTVVFFTDGQPTVDETKPEKIVKNVAGEELGEHAHLHLRRRRRRERGAARPTRRQHQALSTYVRPAEDIETKVTSLYGKISHPVLANVRLTTSENVKLHEIYPPKLPDLFHGTQLVVLGRYSGNGQAAVKLTGQVGKETREFVYDVNVPGEDRRRPRVRRAPVGPAQGRLPARPDPHQRREEGTDRRGDRRWPRSTASRRRTRATWSCRTPRCRSPPRQLAAATAAKAALLTARVPRADRASGRVPVGFRCGGFGGFGGFMGGGGGLGSRQRRRRH